MPNHRAVREEIQRGFTAQWRGQQNFHESTCPNVFLLHPWRDSQTFDDHLDYLRKGESWRLSLYCEADGEWHCTEHGVYEIVLHADWIETLRTRWNSLAGHMRTLAPYLKAASKFCKDARIEASALVVEKLPDIAADHRGLRRELGAPYKR